jgi:6-phosphogluconolactonase
MTADARSPRRISLWGFLLLILVAAAFGPGITTAQAEDGDVGAVYTQTNEIPTNRIIAFDRLANGQLEERERVPTGGSGGRQPQPACEVPPGGCPMLDTQGAVQVTDNGKLLFAVNAGSDTISSFRVTNDGLQLVDVVPSGGDFPQSLTVTQQHGGMLYVLNGNSNSIAGFRFSSQGEIEPIAGSVREVSMAAPVGFTPRQIGFDRTGRVVTVTLIAFQKIDTFILDGDGRPAARTTSPSRWPLPFGFEYDNRNNMVLSEVSTLVVGAPGNTTTYDLDRRSGALTSIDTESSQGPAPCWVVITNDGRHTFVVNAGPAPFDRSIAKYGLFPNGELTPLGPTQLPGGQLVATDEDLSRNSKYLYVLRPALISPTSQIDIFQVGDDGSLTPIGSTPADMPEGVSGLAAR